MQAHYVVGEHHWFIRVTPAVQPIPVSNDLLHPDPEQLCWLRGIEKIEMDRRLCYTHEYDEDGDHFYFRDAQGNYSDSVRQESKETPDWRVVTGGGSPQIYTAFAPLQDYVLKIIHNDTRQYLPWMVDQAKIFQDQLDELRHANEALASVQPDAAIAAPRKA